MIIKSLTLSTTADGGLVRIMGGSSGDPANYAVQIETFGTTSPGESSSSILITTGNTDVNSGNIEIDVGTSSGTTGIINVGMQNASAVNIGGLQNGGTLNLGDSNETQGLIQLSPTRTYITPGTATVLELGPVFYDPNNGVVIRLGSSVFIDGDGVDNFVYGGDATVTNTPGEPLTLRGGAGDGTGAGGQGRLRGGAGGVTGNGGSVVITSGVGGATSGNSGDVDINAGGVTSGTIGSVNIGTAAATNITLGSNAITTQAILLNNRYQGFQDSDVASANDITLGRGNYFDVTGTTTINRIASAGWRAGSVISLRFDSALTVADGVASGGGFASILLNGTTNFTASAGSTLTLLFDGTVWVELSRMTR